MAATQVGDSRAYSLDTRAPSPVLTHLTTDHSMVVELARAGVITTDEMQTSSARHIILRALGGEEQHACEPDISLHTIHAGASFMLCCDGVWNLLSDAQIASVVSSYPPQEACNELLRLANEAGGEDNSSVVIIAFT
jgi:PPM family protein phosphatase